MIGSRQALRNKLVGAARAESQLTIMIVRGHLFLVVLGIVVSWVCKFVKLCESDGRVCGSTSGVY